MFKQAKSPGNKKRRRKRRTDRQTDRWTDRNKKEGKQTHSKMSAKYLLEERLFSTFFDSAKPY